MNLIDQAIAFAALAHEGQMRKHSGLPYIVHPIEVLQIIHPLPFVTQDMRIAAVLHDTLEDTGVSKAEILRRFGLGVLSLVEELTKGKKEPGMNRAAFKAAERERLATVSAEAQTIKLADVLSNTKDTAETDPDFAPTYLLEQQWLERVLRRGNQTLAFRVRDQIDRQLKILDGAVCRV